MYNKGVNSYILKVRNDSYVFNIERESLRKGRKGKSRNGLISLKYRNAWGY